MISELYSVKVQNVSKKFRVYHRERTVFDKMNNIVTRRGSNEELMLLDDISFKVDKGEVLGVIGHNGSGKTTLLRLIARIMRPTVGTIYTEGKVVPILELGTGFDGDLTARENIIQYGIILGLAPKAIKDRVDQIIEFSELEKFADTKLRKFSTGMTARLAFSTAAQVEPDILLVDEVLSVGDLSFQQKSYKAFSSFKEQKKTIVFVSHNLSSIRKLCDRAMLLHDGKIKSIGEVEKVIDAYLETLNMPQLTTQDVKYDKSIEKPVLLETNTYDSQSTYTIEEIRKMINKHEYGRAITHLKPMLEKEPASGQLNYLFAYCLHCSHTDYALSLRHYDLALKHGFQEFWVMYARGSLYREVGDMEAASSDLKRAIFLDPSQDGPKRVLEDIEKVIG
jgi:ABC-type polysaccharide/polyol phosphate transport system ATPase subunit